MFNSRMSTLKERLEELLAETGWDQAHLHKVARVVTSSAVSQWLGKGSKIIQTIGNMEAAIYIERESGFSALWIAKGVGPKKVDGAKAPPRVDPAPTSAQEPVALYGQPTPLSADLIRRIRRMPADEVQRLETVVDAVVHAWEMSHDTRGANRLMR